MEEIKRGLVLICFSIFLLFFSLEMMENWDVKRTDFENECDPMLNPGPKDPQLCAELYHESNVRLSIFVVAIFLFIISGVSGLVTILPSGDSESYPPPGGLH